MCPCLAGLRRNSGYTRDLLIVAPVCMSLRGPLSPNYIPNLTREDMSSWREWSDWSEFLLVFLVLPHNFWEVCWMYLHRGVNEPIGPVYPTFFFCEFHIEIQSRAFTGVSLKLGFWVLSCFKPPHPPSSSPHFINSVEWQFLHSCSQAQVRCSFVYACCSYACL